MIRRGWRGAGHFGWFFRLKLFAVPEQVDAQSELLERRTQAGVVVPALLHDLVYLREKSRKNDDYLWLNSWYKQRINYRLVTPDAFFSFSLMVVYEGMTWNKGSLDRSHSADIGVTWCLKHSPTRGAPMTGSNFKWPPHLFEYGAARQGYPVQSARSQKQWTKPKPNARTSGKKGELGFRKQICNSRRWLG